MKRYEKYKESGVDWIGEIPESWEVRRLAALGRFSASGIDKLSFPNQSSVKIINYTDIYKNQKRIISSEIDFMVVTTPEKNKIKNLVKKGDLIFLPSSETFEDLGLSALVNEDIKDLSFSYHVLRLQFSLNIYHGFKKYFTNNHSVLNNFSGRGVGSIRKTLNRNDFRNTYVILPSLPEQQAIAEFLDDKTAKIDQTISLKQKEINLLKERRQILIQKALTRGIGSLVKMKSCDVDWIGEIPENWKVMKVKYLLKERNERSSKGLEPLLMMSQTYGLVVRADYHSKSEVAQSNEGNKIVHRNDLVFNKLKAHLGVFYKSNIEFNGIVSPDYAIYYSTGAIKDLKFLELLFRNPKYINEFICRATGIVEGLIRLYTADLFDIYVAVPPHHEQVEILSYLEKIDDKISKAILIKEQEIEKLKEYKTVLIDNVVTGKVKVH